MLTPSKTPSQHIKRFKDASSEQQIRKLTEDMEPKVRRAFLDAIEDVRSNVVMRHIVDALERGNISEAIDALNLEQAAYKSLIDHIAQVYDQAGLWQVAAISWRDINLDRIVMRWDMQNPRAQSWLLNYSSERITGGLLRDQIEAVRIVIEGGFALGRGPRDIALDIIGRVGANGRRQGGILGLSARQSLWLTNLRGYLDGDLNRALGLKLSNRDKDIIRRAIDAEKPLTKVQMQSIVSRYERTLLKLRGDTIGRTETAQAVNSARMEAMRQGVDKAGISPDMVEKEWFHAGPAASGKERQDHISLNRTIVQGLDTPFMAGSDPMQYPMDPNAPAEQVINCRCSWQARINWAALAT